MPIRRPSLRILLSLIVLGFLPGGPGALRADWVTFKEGNRRVQCIVLGVNGSRVTMLTGSSQIQVDESAIYGIENESQADNAVLRAEYAYASGEPLLRALEMYIEARDQGATGASLCRSLSPLAQSVATNDVPLPKDAREKMIVLFSSLAGDLSDGASEEFQYYAASALARYGAIDQSSRFFAKLRPGFFQNRPQAREDFASLLIADLQRNLDEGDYQTALERLEAIYAVDGERGISMKALVNLGRAGQAREKGRYAEAIQIYSELVTSQFPEVARHGVWTTMRQAAAAAQETGRFKDAAELYETVGRSMFGDDLIADSLAELYHDWGRAALSGNDFAGAREAFRKRYAILPPDEEEANSGRAESRASGTDRQPRLLALVDYRERRAAIAADSPVEHMQLGQFCFESGLMLEATAEFQIARQDAELRDLADDWLRDIAYLRYEEMLLDAIELNRRAEFSPALEKVATVLGHAESDELRKKAEEIRDLIAKSQQLETQQRPHEAQLLLQSAQQCLLPEEGEKCLALLDQVIQNYPETAAAATASIYLKMILSKGMVDFESYSRQKIEQTRQRVGEMDAADGRIPVNPLKLRDEMARIYRAVMTPVESEAS